MTDTGGKGVEGHDEEELAMVGAVPASRTFSATASRSAAEIPTAPVPAVSEASGGRTTLPTPPSLDEPPQQPRQIATITRADALNLSGAFVAGLCVALLLFGRLAAFSGLVGFVFVTYAGFLVAYSTLLLVTESGPAMRDRIMTVVLYSCCGLMLLALVSVVGFVLYRGHKALLHANFFTQDLSSAGPLAGLNKGGMKHALVGTLWMISIALVLTVPAGLACAVYLNEVGGRLSRFVRTIVEAMTALPSIVAGLFIYIAWILTLHFGHSGFAAALALSVMMLPIIIRASDVVLRLVPGNLREASAALGAPTWRTVWHVVLPTARSGLATAVILGTARGVGETSPVLLTAGYTTYFNNNPFHGPMVSLPLFVFEQVASGVPNYVERGFAAGAFLLLVVLTLFIIARTIGGRGPGQVTKRRARTIRRVSARDLTRFDARAAAS